MNENLILSLFLFAAIAIIIPIVFHFTKYIGPKSDCKIKNEPYESGIQDTIGKVGGTFSIKYYLIAIIFVIFDIEVVFMYPWAVGLRDLGFFGLFEMFVFMGILLLGLAYVYGKKVLRWA